MATKSGSKGRYICKVGFYDIRAIDSTSRYGERGSYKTKISGTDYVVYHGKKSVSKGHKNKAEAVAKATELLGETFREVYNIKA
jgi:hypothetical protein